MVLPQIRRTSSSSPASIRYKPVIGILTHPRDSLDGSIIRKSYVDFVKTARGRAIPLFYNDPHKKLLKKLELVNGVLLPGGTAINHYQDDKNDKNIWGKKVDKYFKAVEFIFKYVQDRNDGKKNGEKIEGKDHFPVYAICLCFEHITIIQSGENNILEKFSAADQASTLDFVEKEAPKGSIFDTESFPQDLLDKLSKDCIVYQNHHFGISQKRLLGKEKLSSFFQILSTSKDKYTEEYVSTMQAYKYPITCFQWHPEKNAFERGSKHIPHTKDAKRVTQFTADFLVREASKSSRRPDAQELRDYLIRNRRTIFRGKDKDGDVYFYVFK